MCALSFNGNIRYILRVTGSPRRRIDADGSSSILVEKATRLSLRRACNNPQLIWQGGPSCNAQHPRTVAASPGTIGESCQGRVKTKDEAVCRRSAALARSSASHSFRTAFLFAFTRFHTRPVYAPLRHDPRELAHARYVHRPSFFFFFRQFIVVISIFLVACLVRERALPPRRSHPNATIRRKPQKSFPDSSHLYKYIYSPRERTSGSKSHPNVTRYRKLPKSF